MTSSWRQICRLEDEDGITQTEVEPVAIPLAKVRHRRDRQCPQTLQKRNSRGTGTTNSDAQPRLWTRDISGWERKPHYCKSHTTESAVLTDRWQKRM